MKRAYKLRVLFLPAALLVMAASAWIYAQSPPPQRLHPREAECDSCHLAGDNTTPVNAHLLRASQEQLCGQCHQDALQLSHPSGFSPAPGQKIADGYPLDWKGDVTCSTCHIVHGDTPGGKLRGTAHGQEMCNACHDQAFFNNMLDGGISLVQSGHLGMPGARDWADLDRYSTQCLECHGEKGDKDEGADPIVLASNQILRHGSLNHPIGRSYAAAATYGGYRPVNKLSKKIHLPNGMISCISCHEGYSKTHGKLVTVISGSKLCFECHDL